MRTSLSVGVPIALRLPRLGQPCRGYVDNGVADGLTPVKACSTPVSAAWLHDLTPQSVRMPPGGITANLTVRGLDDELRKRLERVAEERKESLNATAISLLREYLELPAPPIHRSYADPNQRHVGCCRNRPGARPGRLHPGPTLHLGAGTLGTWRRQGIGRRNGRWTAAPLSAPAQLIVTGSWIRGFRTLEI